MRCSIVSRPRAPLLGLQHWKPLRLLRRFSTFQPLARGGGSTRLRGALTPLATMGNFESKNQSKIFMAQRERTNTEHRKQGTLAMNLVREEFNRDIQEVYDLRSGELLGKGGFGTVRVVTHKATQIKYALKTIELKDVETHEQYEFLLNEIEIMKKLDHPNIARVQEVFHTPDHYYMVMDLYTGGDMYARYKFRSEDDTAKIVNKLINALRYCHDRNVGHRDIKLENICFESMADDAEVKLVDFGLSISFKDEQIRHDLVGSWAFMAPEILQRAHHPQACDLWSMGVVTYCLLVGFPPFRAVNLKQLKDQILYGSVTFEEEPWRNVSDTAKDFILKLLRKDQSRRLTAQQAQQHPWLSTRPRCKGGVDSKLSPKVVENLRQFKNLNLMKRVALGVVARTLQPSEMRTLEQEFHKADRTKSGVISIEDFREILLQSKQFSKKEVDEIFEGVDIGSSGLLSYTDFTAAALDRQSLDTKRLKYAFERLDHDNNGELDYEDLMMTVGSDLTSEDVRTALKQFDPKGNGKVTFDAFCKGMRSAGPLDALATAQLTSGDMVERIAKGEGKEAIQQTLTEIERKTPELLQPGATPTDALEISLTSLKAAMQVQLKDCAAPAEAGAQAPARDSAAATAAMDIVGGANRTKSLVSSARYTACPMSKAALITRPQSYERGIGLMHLSAANAVAVSQGRSVDSAGVAPVVAGGGAATVTIAGASAPGESASVGGGAEATAPSPRKWSKEASPVGGGRADTSVSPGGWAGEKGGGEPLPVVKMELGGEGFRESLADRRMRDSIRLRGISAGGVGAVAGLGFSPRIVAPSSTNLGARVAPGPSPASPLPGVSPVKELSSSSSASSASLTLPLQPQKATVAGEATGAKAGGALGAAAASGKSGGEPAERHRTPLPRKKIAPEDDLPPRDSTAGEADLGWGLDGPPADLVGPPPSSDGSNSSCGSNNVGQRASKALRFGGVSGNVRKGDKRRHQRGNGARHAAQGVFDGRLTGGGVVADVPENDVYRGGDSVCLDDDDFCGGGGDRRRTSTRTFCAPPSFCGGEVPFWMKWMDGIFRGNPDQI